MRYTCSGNSKAVYLALHEADRAYLVHFHTAHKLTLMAHSPKHYTEMGRLVADAGKRDWDQLTAEYGAMLMEGLSVMGTRGKHVNVLQHLMGFLKNHIRHVLHSHLLKQLI